MTEPSPYDFRALRGIERLVATGLWALRYALISYWLLGLFKKYDPIYVIESYVIVCLATTILNWYFGPWFWLSWLCSYFAASTIVVLLQVAFLTKVFGNAASPERSLILFICNVVQIVFLFASWYYLLSSYPREDALFYSVLVLVTAGYPSDAPRFVIELQIASDFMLLTIFIGLILGKIGKPNTSG
jgi:hypothetical protein